MIFGFAIRTESVPPFAQDFADRSIVLVGMFFVDQRAVLLGKDHKRVHGPPDFGVFGERTLGLFLVTDNTDDRRRRRSAGA